MEAKSPNTIYLKDYKEPAFLVNTIDLNVALDADLTKVKSTLGIMRNPKMPEQKSLVLQGDALTLNEIQLNGTPLTPADYTLSNNELIIKDAPEEFSLMIETQFSPRENTTLNGLYLSGDILCTQCEAEGFRRITYFPDRPDVMSLYTTTIIADKQKYPVLLSNGNLIDSGLLGDGKHWVKWQDPYRKPSYLFALVAGNLGCAEDSFVTRSGRSVALKVYVEPGNEVNCTYALQSLKNAMRWDELRFGRGYDLDTYMIVAVSDFNMGAMENKGLNIFNAKYILANPAIATDQDYEFIEAVIAHEYFHNWTGNRVTCRDWFQLSLKEGLTIFREHEFCADQQSREVERIKNVRKLRLEQFPQDEGPMAHPVRPDSYIEINNFYTVTIYEKGAEVIRMLQTMLGRDTFRQGMDIYFARHDGHAVTIEDFVQAMEAASGRDLTQFRRWYTQAGTPELYVTSNYDSANCRYTLRLEQVCPPTPMQTSKEPFLIPVTVSLFDLMGQPLPLQMSGSLNEATEQIMEMTQSVQEFQFNNITSYPIPSLLRDFSAPVKLRYPYTTQDLLVLMRHDTDSFNRWEAVQTIENRLILQLIDEDKSGAALCLPVWFTDAFAENLSVRNQNLQYLALLLALPSDKDLANEMTIILVEPIFKIHKFVKRELATQLKDQWMAIYKEYNDNKPYQFNAIAVGQRSLKNIALSYLMANPTDEIRQLCLRQFVNADNMTDSLAALVCLSQVDCPERVEALNKFYDKWQNEPLVLDKWFAIQAQSHLPNTLEVVKQLITHPKFNWINPNRVRSVIGVFAMLNDINFHALNGDGYAFLADQIIHLDNLNPQVAARLCEPLTRWRRHIPERQALMKKQLFRIMSTPNLSRDVYEIVSKSSG